MYNRFYLLIFLLCCLNLCSPAQVVNYVDPFVGTGAHGHTYPGATVPFGAVQLSPDTRRGNWDACSGYHYSDSILFGFSHTHLSGTGCIDLGDILFHPTVSKLLLKATGDIYTPLAFSHKNESASPGYYKVTLNEGITAELSATSHTGIHRYTFPASEHAILVIDMAHLLDKETITAAEITRTSTSEIVGMRTTNGFVANRSVYFVAQFSKPFSKASLVSNGNIILARTIKGPNIQSVLEFQTKQGESITVKVGLSSVSIDNARENLQKEINGFDFDAVKKSATLQWEKALSTITVSGGSKDDLTTFYSSLFHTMVVPNLISDVNGNYRGADLKIHSGKRKSYSTFSLWDTFRAWNPLMTLVDTTLVNDMVNSMLHFYDQTGELPIWPLASGETGCMIGYHSVSVIYDAYSKNIRNYDVNKAFEAMKVSSDKNSKSTTPFLALGYIPSDLKRESVSCLLENAYDDWCIAQMAKALGRTTDYDIYSRRSQVYKNVYDGSTGFFRGKLKDGNWDTPFDSFEVGRAYTEATAWQYRFFALHDVKGLVNLYGSPGKFIQALDTLFTVSSQMTGLLSDISGMIGQYAHGNEPSHHIPYLYNFMGQPWKTQAMTRRILHEMYQPTTEGISGNEDCGQMSAWYVMSCIGLYQFCPGSGQLLLTTPLFEKSVLRLPNGKVLLITANRPDVNTFIKEVRLNGKLVSANYVNYSDLMKGGELTFVLDKVPDTIRGTRPEDFPYSFSETDEVSVPYITNNVALFENQVTVHAGCTTPNAQIRYSTDGSEPTENSVLFPDSMTLTKTTPIKLKAFKSGSQSSQTMSVTATKAMFNPPVNENLTKHGAQYDFYEGNIKRTTEITSIGKFISAGVCDTPTISITKLDGHFAFIYKGYLLAPSTGIYIFYTNSDDGSVLFIDDKQVVDNDGGHAAVSAFGKVALSKGLHTYELRYFQDYEGQSLEWGWKIPGSSAFEKMPPSALFLK